MKHQNCKDKYLKIKSTNVLDVSMLVQTSTESAHMQHATLTFTLTQILLLAEFHSYAHEHMNNQGVFLILLCGLGTRLVAG